MIEAEYGARQGLGQGQGQGQGQGGRGCHHLIGRCMAGNTRCPLEAVLRRLKYCHELLELVLVLVLVLVLLLPLLLMLRPMAWT